MTSDLETKTNAVTSPSQEASSKAGTEEVYISNCCKKDAAISKGLVRFLTMAFFTALLLAFAMFKLSSQDIGPEEKAVYYSLLASCIAAYTPAPTPHDPPTN